MGEMAIRASTARSVVHYLKMDLSVEDAGRQAMEDLNDLGGRYLARMNLIAMDRNGRFAGFSSAEGKTFLYITSEMGEPVEQERSLVHIKTRWERSFT
jgi:isoaspartyl peptidase/L-asparaginase-like protein (Ntn-hydrolase superfamily)